VKLQSLILLDVDHFKHINLKRAVETCSNSATD